MDDPAVNEILQDNRARADLGLTGTPGFMINGEVIPSYNRPLEQRLQRTLRAKPIGPALKPAPRRRGDQREPRQQERRRA
ncbi:MAG: hypothetical protein R3C16_08815 [Hyphomonadaceae bacterium]